MHDNFLFDRFTEEWASLYALMQHNPINRKRFYMVDNWYSMQPLIEGLDPRCSPSVVLEANLEGRIDDKFDRPTYTVYMIALADEREDNSLVAKRRAKDALLAYRNLMNAFKNADPALEGMPFQKGSYLDSLRTAVFAGRKILQAIDLNIRYESTGRVLDGWYGVFATFEDCTPYNRCIDFNDYVLKEYETEE